MRRQTRGWCKNIGKHKEKRVERSKGENTIEREESVREEIGRRI